MLTLLCPEGSLIDFKRPCSIHLNTVILQTPTSSAIFWGVRTFFRVMGIFYHREAGELNPVAQRRSPAFLFSAGSSHQQDGGKQAEEQEDFFAVRYFHIYHR
jgi:hypothetical protein